MTAWVFDAPAGDLGRMDVAAHGDHYEIVVDVPGVAPERLDVVVERDELVVRGTRDRRRDAGPARTDRFERRLRLGADIPADAVAARLSHGVLTVTVPRATTARRIPIGAATGAPARLAERVRRPWQRLRARRGPALRRSLGALADRAARLRP